MNLMNWYPLKDNFKFLAPEKPNFKNKNKILKKIFLLVDNLYSINCYFKITLVQFFFFYVQYKHLC